MKRVVLLMSALLFSGQVHAAASCTVSANSFAFGTYDVFSLLPKDSNATLTVSCTLSGLASLLMSYNIKLSTGGSGSYAPRKLSSGSNLISYNLYTSLLRTTVWGNGTGSSAVVSDSYLLGLGSVNRQYVVYGRIPAQQAVPGGTYADSITVTVEY